jgi:hypothetical protein
LSPQANYTDLLSDRRLSAKLVPNRSEHIHALNEDKGYTREFNFKPLKGRIAPQAAMKKYIFPIYS